MKKFLIFATTVLMALSVAGCPQSETSSSNTSKTENEAKASIIGKAFYKNSSDAGGIIVTLEKSDGLNTSLIVTGRGESVTSTTTDKDGNYEFKGLEGGTYTVYASSNDSSEKAVCRNVTVEPNKSVTVADLQLTAAGSLSGIIMLADGDETIGSAGFMVFVAGTSYMAMTDTSGAFRIDGIPAGDSYMIIISKNSKSWIWYNTVKVEAGEKNIGAKAFTVAQIGTDGKDGTNGADGADGKDGTNGTNGTDGKDGTSIVWKGAYANENATELANPQNLWAYFNTTDGCSYIYNGTGWTMMASGGKDGAVSTDMIWLGYFSGLPTDDEYEMTFGKPVSDSKMAYCNTADGYIYVWDGSAWSKKTQLFEKLYNVYYYRISPVINRNDFVYKFCVSEDFTIADVSYDATCWKFLGWYDNAAYTGLPITGWKAGECTSYVELYAKWVCLYHSITYSNVSPMINKSDLVDKFYESKDFTIASASYDAAAYKFFGWYDNADYTGGPITGWKAGERTGDVRLWAKWKVNFDNMSENESSVYTATITPDMIATKKPYWESSENTETIKFILVPKTVEFEGASSLIDVNQCYVYSNNTIGNGHIYMDQLKSDEWLQVSGRYDNTKYAATAVKKDGDNLIVMIDLSKIKKDDLLSRSSREIEGNWWEMSREIEGDWWDNFDKIEKYYVPYLLGSVTRNYYTDITMWGVGVIKMKSTTESFPADVEIPMTPVVSTMNSVYFCSSNGTYTLDKKGVANGVYTFEKTFPYLEVNDRCIEFGIYDTIWGECFTGVTDNATVGNEYQCTFDADANNIVSGFEYGYNYTLTVTVTPKTDSDLFCDATVKFKFVKGDECSE